jgi:hypothetical protein
MGDLTLANFRDHLEVDLGGRQNDSTFTEARKNRVINFALRRVGVDVLPKEVEESFTSTLPYTGVVATDVSTAESSLIGSSQELLKPASLIIYKSGSGAESRVDYLDIKLFREKAGIPAEHGASKPRLFSRWDGTILWDRAPDQAYSFIHEYWRFPASLSADADQTELSIELDQAVQLAAAAHAHRSLGNLDKVQSYEQAYLQFLASNRVNKEPTGARRVLPRSATRFLTPYDVPYPRA